MVKIKVRHLSASREYWKNRAIAEWGLKLLNSQLDTLVELVKNSNPIMINQKLIEKLGWLVDYQPELIRWHQMTVLTDKIV